MNIQTIWRRVTATRYTRALEVEVARLRAENRALLNSILGIAGVPPITVLPDSVSIGAQDAQSLHLESGRGNVPVGASQSRFPSATGGADIVACEKVFSSRWSFS